MSDEPENEFEGTGDAPGDLPAESAYDKPDAASGEPEFHRKPFSAWRSAQAEESGPSLWHRTSQRLRKMFGRKERPAEVEAADEPSPDVAEGPSFDEPDATFEPDSTGAGVQSGIEPSAEPKEDLKFLWSPAAESSESAVEPDSEPSQAFSDGLEVAEARSLLDDEPPPPKKPGLLRRLFSPRSKPAIPDPEELPDEAAPDVVAESDATAPVDEWNADVTAPMDVSNLPSTAPMDVSHLDATAPMDVSALDDALPMDASASASEPPAADFGATVGEVPSPVARKPGFFARMMGRSAPSEDATAGGDDLAAAHDVFAAAKDEFVPEQTQAESFASVDDALPAEPAAVPPELDQSFQAMPVYDFDAPKANDRATMEVDQPAATPDDSRPTAEVSASDVDAHADEEERDTDEFEMVDLDATIAEDPDKTSEVKREPGFFKKLFSKTKEVTQVEPAVAPPPTANPTFLVQKFRTFYNEVVVYKNQKAEFTAGFATAILTDYTADLSPEQAAQSLIARLQQMLELQLAESSWMGGEAAELYPEAQYAMTVLADEMLSHMEWPGQGAWGQHRLELAVFRTAAADVEFFKRVDRLLKNGPQTTGTRDLARVYLLVIASGFRGKYRPFDLFRPLAEYRRRVYVFVYGGDALLLYADDRRIFPEATSVTVAGKGVRRFSMAQQWAAILVLLLAGYTVISYITWNRVSADLKDIAARVEQARTSTTAVPDSPNGGGGR